MVAAKADGKAKIAAQLQMRPMPIQRVVCEFLLTDFYDGDGDGDDGDDDDGNDADDDVEEEEVCENLGASGVMIALYLSRVIASRVNTEALTCDLMYSEQWWTVDLDFSVLTHSDTIGEHADSAEDWAKYPMAIPHCDESGEVERWQVQNSGHKNGLSNQSYQQCL